MELEREGGRINKGKQINKKIYMIVNTYVAI